MTEHGGSGDPDGPGQKAQDGVPILHIHGYHPTATADCIARGPDCAEGAKQALGQTIDFFKQRVG
jgi:hypothetical protein